jgi:3-oxoadipate enol-lactonase
MATFTHQGQTVHYVKEGAGEPILILNGIMMSTKSWEPFVGSLTAHNTLIRLDFFDQGASARMTGPYTQDVQSDLVEGLLDHLGIEKINIVGISYGGEVALLFAVNHPDRVRRLVVFNATSYTSPWLKDIGRQWIAIGKTRDGQTYYKATIPVIYSPTYYETNLEWMRRREALLVPLFSNPEFLDAMERLTLSAESYDVRKSLDVIDAPTLIVAADEDYLTPLPNQRALKQMIRDSELVILPGVGHASMYERPKLFVALILGFINQDQTSYTI